MARNFRFYEKKRGHRRTGSQTLANAGEAAFFAVLLLLGCAGNVAAVLWLVIPEWRVNHGFVEQKDCTVIASAVGEKETDSGTVYRPEIKIQYEVNGIRYLPVTYDIHHAWSSNREEVQAAVDAFVEKQTCTCWYDPADPGRAVVVRGYEWWTWLVFIVPGSLVVIGTGGLIYALVHWGKSAECRAAMARRTPPLEPYGRTDCQSTTGDRTDWQSVLHGTTDSQPATTAAQLPNVPDASDIESSPGTKLAFRLPLTRSPAWALFGLFLASLLWNGPVVAFVVFAIRYHSEGRPDWPFTIFVAACLAGGIALVVFFFRQLVVTTRIGPTLVEISAHPLLPGSQCQLFVSQSGRLKMKSLEVALVCEEEATYRQGTNTRTETREVYRQPVLRRDGFAIARGEPFAGECLLQVPVGAMHSFKAGHNQVRWKVLVQGDASGWPKFERSFPVIVHPSSGSSAV